MTQAQTDTHYTDRRGQKQTDGHTHIYTLTASTHTKRRPSETRLLREPTYI